MGRSLTCLAAAALLTACAAAATGSAVPRAGGPAVPPGGYDALEHAVLAELNAARTNPTAYARGLDALIPHFDGRVLRRPGSDVGVTTHEGVAAIREAAGALRAMQPVPALARSSGMSEGARDHVEDQGPRGVLGHAGADGSSFGQRVNRYGTWLRSINESISYGPATGVEVVQGLIIDDGVPDRGHRRNLLDPGMRVAGVACGPHARYRVMCVIDLAAGYEDRPAR